MRKPIALILAAAGATMLPCAADPLSPADREALLDKLEQIRDSVQSKTTAKFGSAITAFRSAMGSPEGTITLYLKCVEKIDFTDRDRKAADFRAWKRRQDDQLENPGFALALRHQLRWLVLTLQASAPKADKVEIAALASDILDGMFRDAPRLEGQAQLLEQPVYTTVFARAYDLGRPQVKDWPAAPLEIEKIYNQVILPPLRDPKHLDALKEAWAKRIQQEALLATTVKGGGRRGDPAAAGKFELETRPDLEWQAEVDLFESGDEKGAALRMLEHIEENLDHKNARNWGAQFRELLNPKEAAPSATAAAGTLDE